MATVRLTLLLIVGGKGEAAPEGRGKASSPRAAAAADTAQPGPRRPCCPAQPRPVAWLVTPWFSKGSGHRAPGGALEQQEPAWQETLPAPIPWRQCPLTGSSEPAGWVLRLEQAGDLTPTGTIDHLLRPGLWGSRGPQRPPPPQPLHSLSSPRHEEVCIQPQPEQDLGSVRLILTGVRGDPGGGAQVAPTPGHAAPPAAGQEVQGLPLLCSPTSSKEGSQHHTDPAFQVHDCRTRRTR